MCVKRNCKLFLIEMGYIQQSWTYPVAALHRCNRSLIRSLSDPLPPITLRRRQAQTLRNFASNHNKDYFAQVEDILNLKGYQDFNIDSTVTRIWVKTGLQISSFKTALPPFPFLKSSIYYVKQKLRDKTKNITENCLVYYKCTNQKEFHSRPE